MDNSLSHTAISGKIGFIGAGNMAKAIGIALIRKGLINSSNVYVSAPSKNNLVEWKNEGANVTHDNVEVVTNSDVIILAMKPQYLDQSLTMFEDLSINVSQKIFISVLAGVTIETLQKKLSVLVACSSIARVMPNTPLLVGAGCSVFSTWSPVAADCVTKIFSPLGLCLKVDEKLINAAASISACGPAFMYILMEALADGGVKMGVPRHIAQNLAAQTMLGSAQMVLQTGRHPGQLKDEVCSPGGTTIAGVHALEKSSVRSAMMAAVEASTMRTYELGNQ